MHSQIVAQNDQPSAKISDKSSQFCYPQTKVVENQQSMQPESYESKVMRQEINKVMPNQTQQEKSVKIPEESSNLVLTPVQDIIFTQKNRSKTNSKQKSLDQAQQQNQESKQHQNHSSLPNIASPKLQNIRQKDQSKQKLSENIKSVVVPTIQISVIQVQDNEQSKVVVSPNNKAQNQSIPENQPKITQNINSISIKNVQNNSQIQNISIQNKQDEKKQVQQSYIISLPLSPSRIIEVESKLEMYSQVQQIPIDSILKQAHKQSQNYINHKIRQNQVISPSDKSNEQKKLQFTQQIPLSIRYHQYNHNNAHIQDSFTQLNPNFRDDEQPIPQQMPMLYNTNRQIHTTRNHPVRQMPIASIIMEGQRFPRFQSRLQQNTPQSQRDALQNIQQIRASSPQRNPIRHLTPLRPIRIPQPQIIQSVEPPSQNQLNFAMSILCAICFSEQKNIFTLPCGHIFCRPCLRKYLQQNMRSGNFLVMCPEFECQSQMHLQSIKQLLPQYQYPKFEQFYHKFIAESNPNNRFCTKPDCGKILEINGQKLVCPKCKCQYCPICHQQSHQRDPCKSTTKDALDLGKLSLKKCPNCRAPIQKNDGCNHMTCKNCKYQFCWLCQSQYTRHHFRLYNCCGCPGLMFGNQEQRMINQCKQAIFYILLPFMLILTLLVIIGAYPVFMIGSFIIRPFSWIRSDDYMCQKAISQWFCCGCFCQHIFAWIMLQPRALFFALFLSPIILTIEIVAIYRRIF